MNYNYLNYSALIIGTLLIAFILSFIARRLLNLIIDKYSERIKVDPTNFSFIKNSASIIIYSVAIIFIFLKIPYLRSLGTALFAGAGDNGCDNWICLTKSFLQYN